MESGYLKIALPAPVLSFFFTALVVSVVGNERVFILHSLSSIEKLADFSSCVDISSLSLALLRNILI
jgi:hypothetical protein